MTIKKDETIYYWIRVYDYVYERDMYEKGTLLDEFYLKDVEGGREEVKRQVKEKYCTNTSKDLKFAKPRKQSDGIYANIMDSNQFFYDRFYKTINTLCFWCHNPIKGKASEFPRTFIGEGYEDYNNVYSDNGDTAYFCKYDCKADCSNSLKNNEGEYQLKEEGQNGKVFGYIYLIYNRVKNINYIGQTRYMPFFRWQEHIKDGQKGDISDLSFSVLAEVFKHKGQNDEQNQLYLNSIEAWWIAKFTEENQEVFNIARPKITIPYLKERFQDMVIKQERLLI